MYGLHLKALIWKDFRQQCGFLVAAAVFLLVPYLIATIALIVNRLGAHPVEEWIRFYYAASVADLALAAVLAGFIAGNAIAGERGDRSAEFTAYLPIERGTAVACKALVALGISASLVGICLVFTYVTTEVDRGQGPRPLRPAELGLLMATCGMMFGVAWLVSSFARSAVYAAACGPAVAVCIGMTLGLLSETEAMKGADIGGIYLLLCLIVGAGGFIAGVVHYVRRIEP